MLTPDWLLQSTTTRDEDVCAIVLAAGATWDAVRTPAAMGRPVLDRILASPDDAAQLGPVLEDTLDGALYWLVSPGSSDDYPGGVRLLGTGSWIAVPAPEATRSRSVWVHLPEQRIVTSAPWLATALSEWVEVNDLMTDAYRGHLTPTSWRRLDELSQRMAAPEGSPQRDRA